MKLADGIGTLLVLGAALGLGSLGSRIASNAPDPIPSVTHAFEVSSGKFEKVQKSRPVVAVPIVENPDSDSVLWVNIIHVYSPRTDRWIPPDHDPIPPTRGR